MKKLLIFIALIYSTVALGQPGKDFAGSNFPRYSFNQLYVYYGGAYHLVLDRDAADLVYPQLASSYANPAWITSLAQSKITYTGTTLQYIRGDGTTATFPTDLSSFTNGPAFMTDVSTNTIANKTIGGNMPVSLDNTYTLGNAAGRLSGVYSGGFYGNNYIVPAAAGSMAVVTSSFGTIAKFYNSTGIWFGGGTAADPGSGVYYFNGTLKTNVVSSLLKTDGSGNIGAATPLVDYITPTGTTAQYIKGDGTFATFPTVVSSFTNDAGYWTNTSTKSLGSNIPIATDNTSSFGDATHRLSALFSAAATINTLNMPSAGSAQLLNTTFGLIQRWYNSGGIYFGLNGAADPGVANYKFGGQIASQKAAGTVATDSVLVAIGATGKIGAVPTTTFLKNPMTTLGDIIYGGASGAPTRLSGNTANTTLFLKSTGSSGSATAPSYYDLFGVTNVWSSQQWFTGGLQSQNIVDIQSTNFAGTVSANIRYTDLSASKTLDLYPVTLTANRAVRLQDANGTLALTADLPVSGSYSSVGAATTTFTVTIGTTQANNTYKVQVTPTDALASALFYVTNKTTTTFDVVYATGLTGTVSFDWSLFR